MKKTDEGNTGLRKVDSRCRGGSSWEGEEGKEENEATCRSLTETVSTNTRQVPRLPLPLFREELASLSLKRNSSSRPLRLPASLSPATWRAISLSFHSFFLLSFYFLLVLIFPRPSFHPSFLDSSSVRHRFFFSFFFFASSHETRAEEELLSIEMKKDRSSFTSLNFVILIFSSSRGKTI